MTTFAEQAKAFLAEGSSRAKKPFRAKTVRTYSSHIYATINPLIGDMKLEDVGNKLLKSVCEELLLQDFAPKAIQDILSLIKQVVKSAVDADGEFLHPRNWNAKFIDAPSIEDQKQPTVTAETLQEAIRRAIPQDKALYALLAGSGLRINEALDIRAFDDGQKTYFDGCGTIFVRTQRGGETTKTKAGIRQVDLTPELAAFIMQNAKTDGVHLFPESETAYRERLEKNGILGGFHTFRRFRISYLKSVSVPDMLIKFWNGHAAGDITERYTKVGSEIQTRKETAAKAGLGFVL